MESPARLTFGFPRMHKEAGERRDFLPDTIAHLTELGVQVFVEKGIGSGMGLTDADYTRISSRVRVVDNAQAFAQDVVLVLRCPELEELDKLKPGATLMSMLHFPTRPRRVRRLLAHRLHGIGLDSIADDDGRRLVENMRAVAWNGVEAAFDALERLDSTLAQPGRAPLRVTVLGAGQVGKHAIEAATKYGSLERFRRLQAAGATGVEVTVLGRMLTPNERYLKERFAQTDLLIDASQRTDPTRPLIPNAWLSSLPKQAVICDLVVDPYVVVVTPPTVRSIEGIPMGSLDKFIFAPTDADWCATIPDGIPTEHRRTTATCYSWPGVHPRDCMAHYHHQLAPLLTCLVERGGVTGLRPDGEFYERSLHRATLEVWAPRHGEAPLKPVEPADDHD